MPCYMEAIQLGALDYIEKPLLPSEIGLLVRKYLRTRTASAWVTAGREDGVPVCIASPAAGPVRWQEMSVAEEDDNLQLGNLHLNVMHLINCGARKDRS